jgi:hypothetical protein
MKVINHIHQKVGGLLIVRLGYLGLTLISLTTCFLHTIANGYLFFLAYLTEIYLLVGECNFGYKLCQMDGDVNRSKG